MKYFMKKARFLPVSIILIILIISTDLQAKTLVYCSEGQYEGLNSQLFASGTIYDASSSPLYNRLVEFQLGTAEIKPVLAERWQVSDDGKIYFLFYVKVLNGIPVKTLNQVVS